MSKQDIHRTFRFFGILIGITAFITAFFAVAILFKIHISNEWQAYIPLPHATAPGSGRSIIVFAPHSDDETLGCAGMISEAHKNGAKVRVVLITNGDGFRIAVGRAFKTLKVTPKKCIEFAYKRQIETQNAMAALGLPKSDVTFLGYPDRGVAQLWNRYWDKSQLYYSNPTGSDHTPYVDSFTRNAPYCGESLVSDIEKVLKQTKPTDVYMPHPTDNHPDHYATYCFVMAAIKQLQSDDESFASKIRPHTYIVHRGDWPLPKGDHPEVPLVPPYALARSNTRWESLSLPENVYEEKRNAINQYKTQTDVERSFMMSFARHNEIFGDLPDSTIAFVRPGKIKIDGKPEDWNGLPPVVVDPVGDYVVAGMNRGGDIHSIYLATDKNYLYFRLDCSKKISRQITYRINFRGLNKCESNERYTISIKPRKKVQPADTIWACSGHIIEIAIPLKQLRFDRDVFVKADTKFMNLTVDNTGWNGFAFDKKCYTSLPNK